jgi:hypothetical protein
VGQAHLVPWTFTAQALQLHHIMADGCDHETVIGWLEDMRLAFVHFPWGDLLHQWNAGESCSASQSNTRAVTTLTKHIQRVLISQYPDAVQHDIRMHRAAFRQPSFCGICSLEAPHQ